jgi:predicted DNA-binding transcriptional regulator AlpA
VSRRADILPALEPRGLARAVAAAYVGISASLFDRMVADGRMPQPKMVDKRLVWDRRALDEAFADLPERQADGSTPELTSSFEGWQP